MPLHHFLDRLELHHVQYRREDLLVDDRHIRSRFHQRRFNEAAAERVPAKDDLPTLFLNQFDRRGEIFDRARVDQRTHQRMRVQGIADAHLTVYRYQFRSHLPSDSFLQEEPPDCSTALTGGSNCAEDHGAQSQVEVRVVHDNDPVVAAQFEQCAAEAPADGFGNDAPRAARSGRADERNAVVREQPVSDRFVVADDQAKDALPPVALQHAVADLLDRNRGERSLARGFP